MTLKNGTGLLVFLSLITIREPANALVFPDQIVGVAGYADEENPDASSRFGADTNAAKRNQVAVAIPLHPIAESSFEQEVSRGPASVGGRGPAAIKTVKPDHPKTFRALVKRARGERAYQEAAVIANDLGFFPSTLFLTQGIPVRLYVTGASAKSQCFMLDQFGVRRQIRSQKIEEITFTPDQNGTFSFTCPMNGAKGTVVVKELELSGRVPANVNLSQAEKPAVANAPEKHSEIKNDDFTSEFRNE